jgi:2,3-diaminopropionate biosynthesis protein SbnB
MNSKPAPKASKAVGFIYLQQEDVIACGGLEMRQVIDAVEHAYVLHEQGECLEPEAPLIQWTGPQGKRILAHPAWVGGDVGMAGIKWIPSNPANPQELGMPRASAIIILNDDETGYPLAVMDGTVISAARTGAATGVGARYLAKADSERVSIIGAGPISRTQIMALQVVLPALGEVSIYDLDRKRAEAVAAEMRALYPDIGFIVAPSAEGSVRSADVVVTVTSGVSLERAYLEAGWLKEGVLVSTVAANDSKIEVVEQADKLVMTNLEELDNPIWLAGLAVARGVRSRGEFVSLGSIITGQNPGRENDRERIFFNPGGMGIEDVAAATRVYRNALERGIGKQLELWREPIWV